MSDDPRVKAIRNDRAVGKGSCSSLDECYTDDELAKRLDEESIKTPRKAIQWARKSERLWLERGCEQRWGDADDPQLSTLKDFKRLCRENPIEVEP